MSHIAQEYANCHISKQGTNDTLIHGTEFANRHIMSGDFRSALLWHMEEHGKKISDIARGTGVTRDVITKIVDREGASTNAEKAVRIAGYFGKTLEDFIARRSPDEEDPIIALIAVLTEEERDTLLRQARGLLATRG